MYGFVIADCGACGYPFTFHPSFVPSLNNTPFCASCMSIVNAKRKDKGLTPHPIHPQAYEIFEESKI